jgi:hypothetical protein
MESGHFKDKKTVCKKQRSFLHFSAAQTGLSEILKLSEFQPPLMMEQGDE